MISTESSDDDEYQLSEKSADAKATHENNEDSDDDMNAMENNMNWRDNLAQKARAAYLERQSNTQNLMKIVYGAINAVKLINIQNFELKMFIEIKI